MNFEDVELEELTVRELEELISAAEAELSLRDAADLGGHVEAPPGRENLHRCACGRLYEHEPAAPVAGGVWYLFLSGVAPLGQILHESVSCACGAGLPPGEALWAANRGGAALF